MFRPIGLTAGFCAFALAAPVISQTVPPPTPVEAANLTRSVLFKEESARRIKEARALLHHGAVADSERLLAGANFIVDSDAVEGGAADIARAIIALSDGELRAAWGHAWAVRKAADRNRDLLLESVMLEAFAFAKANLWSSAVKSMDEVRQMDPENRAAKYLSELFEQNKKREGRIWGGLRVPGFVCEFALRPIPREGKGPAYVLYYYDLDGQPLRVMDFDTMPPEEALDTFSSSFSFADDTYPNDRLPKLRGRYNYMRAELEALVALQQGIAPLAAGWAKYVLAPSEARRDLKNARLLEEQVIKPLQQEHAANWEHVASWDTGPYQPSGYRVVEYRNLDFANGKRDDVRGPYETWYYTVFSRNPMQYLGCFSITSEEPEPGMRLWFLKRNLWGRHQVVKAYPSRPGGDRVRVDVIDLLQQSTAPPISASQPVRIDDSLSDQFDAYDEETKDWQKVGALRKYYRIQMAAGHEYVIDLTSRDFYGCVRLEDGDGKQLAEKRSEADPFAAQVRFTARRDGVYRIVVKTWDGPLLGQLLGNSGRYTLTVRDGR